MSFKKNLLIISHHYNTFVKDSSESISPYFKNINVCVRYNIITKLFNYLPIDLKMYKKKTLIDLLNLPKNIHIIPTYIFYRNSQIDTFGDKHFRSIEKTIKKNDIQIDLIHSHFIWSAGYAGAKLKEKYNVPFIVTAHGYDIYDLPFRDNEWKEKIEYVLNSADYIITVSNSNLECIKKLNVKTPVKVIPNGYRSDLFHKMDSNYCRKVLDLPLDKIIVLTVGNLVKVKGHKNLIKAIREVVESKRNILSIIVGRGELKSQLMNQIKDEGLEDLVMLVGPKSHDEIPLWINACDLFVLPSLNEGNPTVMFECLACGKPFIGTRVGGIPEIINSEEYGFSCNPNDPYDLAEKILMGLEKEWDTNRILNYSKQFEWNKIVEQLMGVYNEVQKKY